VIANDADLCYWLISVLAFEYEAGDFKLKSAISFGCQPLGYTALLGRRCHDSNCVVAVRYWREDKEELE